MKRIKRLDQTTINKIAAGEVLQRPANALKELLENSLDAQASTIAVSVLDGGLKSLIVTDDGVGIHYDDLAIVCERFTTSKLETFTDLVKIQTFGFRGEALASMTHVGHVSIRTRMKDQDVAWIARYENGKLLEKPKPIAGNQGTMITVQDLFYNVPARKRGLKNPNEEYARILDVCGKYAIHNPGIAFMCKKQGTYSWDICTQKSSHLANIGLLYGKPLVKELILVNGGDESLGIKYKGYISNSNHSEKKFTFILFINERLVEHSMLKKGIENIYASFLMKGSYPFVYLALTVKSENIDVNVHPTKQQVHFLYEDFIVENICKSLSSSLSQHNCSKSFMTQTLLPQSMVTEIKVNDKTPISKKQPEHKLVRTDSSTRTLDSYLTPKPLGKMDHVIKVLDFNSRTTPIKDSEANDSSKSEEKRTKQHEIVDVQLISVLSLREAVENDEHNGLTEMFRNHTFVGLVDDSRALIQFQTKLLMVNFQHISRLFFYQVLLYGFANFSKIAFDLPVKISDLLTSAFATDTDLEQISDPESIQDLLIDKREMLSEYFSMEINEEGELESLPVLLKGYLPSLGRLPRFLNSLGTKVDWTKEKPCFKMFSSLMSEFYEFNRNSKQTPEEYAWNVEHILFPALKSHFIGLKSICDNGTIVELAQLPELYKIFERC